MLNRIHLTWVLCWALMMSGFGCAVAPKSSYLRRLSSWPAELTENETGVENLSVALAEHLRALKCHSNQLLLDLKDYQITHQEYCRALNHFAQWLRERSRSAVDIRNYLITHFDVWQAGRSRWWRGPKVLITGYFHSIIPARHAPDGEFVTPVLGVPSNLVRIKNSTLQAADRPPPAFQWGYFHYKSGLGYAEVEPLPPRGEVLPWAQQNEQPVPVLGYARLLDLFFMQIQGSGTLEFPDGTVKVVGYAAQNGWPYTPIGKFLLDQIPLEEMSLERIEAVVAQMPSDERVAILNRNQSYVFFQELPQTGVTAMGAQALAGRSVATDRKFYPKGLIGLLSFARADAKRLASLKQPSVSTAVTATRIIFDQDVGGAIRGPNRLDLYLGKGEGARAEASGLKAQGELYYLLPKTKP